jgi:ATP-dependent DNA helicase RecG
MDQVIKDLRYLEEIIQKGESEILERKKSIASLSSTGETLSGFLNGKGGKVFIGISEEGRIIGQKITDSTLREIAEVLKKFEPPAAIELTRIEIEDDREVIVLTAAPRQCDMPYTFNGRAYQRIGSTTSRMPQQTYQRLLLEREHNNHRWETEVAKGYALDDLDFEEIWRTIRMGIEAGRLPGYPGEDIPSILNRLGLRKNEQLLNAAVVLFGKRFLPEFIQCQLRLARFIRDR